ncbi:hypothetical protein F5X99DRAFT_201161 [Biscogniauxia marginata]|nr:hypothetical protein F5X99DRAFT_201161 [Biscogniauxia marginata]
MDTSSLVATWLSFVVTTVGLGGLITQASAINDQMDPFHATRTVEYLGVWFQRQARFPWWTIARPPPQGPVVSARIADGFCGVNRLHVTRIPLARPGLAGWSLVLAMFNSDPPPPLLPPSSKPGDGDAAEKAAAADDSQEMMPASSGGGSSSTGSGAAAAVGPGACWDALPRRALTKHQSSACIVISRTTLITMLVFTNGRPVFQFSDATGFRAGYASYCGQWYITWPIGQEAIIKFAAHDSIGATEVYPRSFAHRIDRCGQMASGVVASAAGDFKVAFCGRKAPGTYRLEHAVKGFQGAHGGRHLYNMMGGRAYEVDFMFARPLLQQQHNDSSSSPSSSSSSDNDNNNNNNNISSSDDDIVLDLPSTEKGGARVKMLLGPREQAVVRRALDCLPWSPLSWSMHRGLRDVLVAYARPVMDAHRARLAARVRRAVAEGAAALCARGWDRAFVRDNMAHMAASAVLAGAGNSGDSVRVVTDVVAVMVGAAAPPSDSDLARLDEVDFWRKRGGVAVEGKEEEEGGEEELDSQAVIALAKVFVLEWSQEFDYQMYHHLPISLYFA